MVFIDPTNDWAFKRIFGSRDSGPVLVGFLNDLLHGGRRVIVSVQILDPYLPSQVKELKNTAVDVRALLVDGSEVLIEMQMFPVTGFCERVLYNGSKCMVSQLGRGTDYTRLRPVTVITIADCVLLPDSTDWLNHYALRETRTGAKWPTCGIEVVFIELPKVKLDKLESRHPLHDWLEFLKNAADWRKIPPTLTNTAVREALLLARHDNLSPKESDTMTRRQLYRQDQINMRRYAIEEGLKEGRQQGMQEGIQEGRQQGLQQGIHSASQEIARRMLAAGVIPSQVVKFTGLQADVVAGLAKPKTKERAAAAPRRKRVTKTAKMA